MDNILTDRLAETEARLKQARLQHRRARRAALKVAMPWVIATILKCLPEYGQSFEMSAALLIDFVDQYGQQPDEWRYTSRKRRSSMVYSALNTLRRQGKVETSLGTSPATGKEIRLFELARGSKRT